MKKSNMPPIIKKHIPSDKNNFQYSLSSGLGLIDTIKAPNPKITKSIPETYKRSSGQGLAQHFIFEDLYSVDEPAMKLTKWSDILSDTNKIQGDSTYAPWKPVKGKKAEVIPLPGFSNLTEFPLPAIFK